MLLKKFVECISLEEATVDAGVSGETTKADLDTPEVIDSESIDKDIESALDLEPSESIEKELETVEKVTVALEHYQTILTASLERGGLRPEEGQMLNVALEHFDSVLGLESGVLSMEDFGGKMSRREATQVSLENIGDKLKAAGKEAWRLIQELVRKIAEQINGALAKSERLTVFFEATAKQAREQQPSEVKGGGFKVTLKSPLAATGDVATAAQELIKVCKQVQEQTRVADGFLAKVTQEFKSGALETNAISGIIGEANPFLKLKDATLEFGSFFKTEFKGDIGLTVKHSLVAEGDREVDISFADYLRLNGYTKEMNTAVRETIVEINKAQGKLHSASEELRRATADQKDPALADKLNKLSVDMVGFISGVRAWAMEVGNVEVAIAHVLRQVQKELERRTTGKGSTDE